MRKIHSLDSLAKIVTKFRAKRKKIIHCHGVFDLLHIGHIKHFKEAKSLGDILVVTITSDKFVNKGPNRPAFGENSRAEAIAALNDVDFVAINKDLTAVSAIKKIKPNIYCKGPDYKIHQNDISGEIKNEITALKKVGGKIYYTKDITFSSSKLINTFDSIYSKEQKSAFKRINKIYSFGKIKKLFENFKKLKVLVIGETIIDQYHFCEALGKSGKEPVLVLKDLKSEEYLGGAVAISRHLSDFCNNVTLMTMLGEKEEFLGKIKKDLPKNIKLNYIKKQNSPTILKKRFLDDVSNSKVLGVYKINDEPLSDKNEQLLNKKLKKLLSSHDLVITSDYGHGFISKKNSDLICKYSKYLALNAQVNAANIGYHSMKKYKNINCVIINERELRYEIRDKNSKINVLMKKFSSEKNIKNLIVTRGKEGSILYNKIEKKFYFCDAFAKKSVDKIGAGDSMLSILALCMKFNLDKELSLLTASLAAAQSVENFGNKVSINKIKILKSIEHILK